MDRTERFYKIKELLRQRRVVSFAELQSELEVSRSTLKRDLDYLSTSALQNSLAKNRRRRRWSVCLIARDWKQ